VRLRAFPFAVFTFLMASHATFAGPRAAATVIPAAVTPTEGRSSGEPDLTQQPEAPTSIPSPTVTAVPRPSPTPGRYPGASVSGITATWYCRAGVSRCTAGYSPSCLCAAISPDLAYLRGRHVDVCAGGRCVRVLVVDCDCAAHRGIDLYAAAFEGLAPLSRGRITVTIRA
jgi:hypothetical protein